MYLTRPTQMCWICGKAVSPETLKTDEHGSTVHSRCYEAKLALATASLGALKIPPATLGHTSLMAFSDRGNDKTSLSFLKTGTE
ncbi:MAG TPA: hypothetical protein VF123_08280 [Candidatus Sulfotelmatobacter sp.]